MPEMNETPSLSVRLHAYEVLLSDLEKLIDRTASLGERAEQLAVKSCSGSEFCSLTDLYNRLKLARVSLRALVGSMREVVYTPQMVCESVDTLDLLESSSPTIAAQSLTETEVS